MVRAIMIVEMAGRPATHLTESLEKHVGILNKIKDIEVHSINVSEPRLFERSEDDKKVAKEDEMFTAFAECDIECTGFDRLTHTMFDFMPSSVEVIEPGKLSLESSELTELLNNISGRLHRYDEIAKALSEKYKQVEAYAVKMKEEVRKKDEEIAELKKGGKKKSKKKVNNSKK